VKVAFWKVMLGLFIAKEDVGIIMRNGKVFYFKDKKIIFFNSRKMKGINFRGQKITIHAFQIIRIGSLEEIKRVVFFIKSSGNATAA